MSDVSTSLLVALSENDSVATAAWKQWRSSVDIQHLTWPDMQMLAILNGPRFEGWLAEDEASGILKGIVRRSWTEAQIRLALVREVVEVLEVAGRKSVTIIGAVGAYLRNLNAPSIRPILEIRILVPRGDLDIAARALRAEGWQSDFDVPVGDDLDWNTSMYFSRNGSGFFLHWGALRVDANRAEACEGEFLAAHCVVETMGTQFPILNPEHALLEALSERDASVDVVPWQADAVLILRERLGWIDWQRWTELAARYDRKAFDRIPELRAMGLDIPALEIPTLPVVPSTSRGKPGLAQRARSLRWAAGRWVRRVSATLITRVGS